MNGENVLYCENIFNSSTDRCDLIDKIKMSKRCFFNQ